MYGTSINLLYFMQGSSSNYVLFLCSNELSTERQADRSYAKNYWAESQLPLYFQNLDK